MTKLTRRKMEDILLEAEAITSEQLQEAVVEQKKGQKRLGEVLLDKGFITEEKLYQVLEEQLGIPQVNLYKCNIDPEIATSIPLYLAQRYKVIPVEERNNKIVLAMSDPMNIIAVDDVAMITQKQVEPVLTTESAVNYAINQYFGFQESLEDGAEERKRSAENEEEVERVRSLVEDAPIVKVVNSFIQQAVKEGASDIHIEPSRDGVQVRMRIDGVLHKMASPPRDTQPLIVSRIKIMANMDIAERRLPQDGRIQVKAGVGLKDVNMRVSTMPTIYGEKVVIRVLEKDKIVLPLEKLGLSERNLRLFKQLLMNRSGMLLVTGPTGCGKTTTLYSALNYLNSYQDNIITVEDPVEYHLEGISQVQVNPRIKLTFAGALRSILRQDPNIVMVGEIRDLETAEIATRAALTGHLVLSTLHTNSAAEAVTRLGDMGVPHYLVTSSLAGVIAQRLVRVLCEPCREEYSPSPEEKIMFHKIFGKPAPPTLLRGRGCRECNEAGYRGRVAIHELMVVNQSLRSLILEGTPGVKLHQKAMQQGMVPLLQDGLEKMEQGRTTFEEVRRAAFSSGFDEDDASDLPSFAPKEKKKEGKVEVELQELEESAAASSVPLLQFKVEAPSEAAPGESLTVKYYLSNEGAGRLKELAVKDELLGGDRTHTIPKLDPGEQVIFTGELTVPDTPLDRLEGSAEVTASLGSREVTVAESYAILILRPGVSLEKSIPGKVQAGETATFDFVVSNRGSKPLYSVSVKDPLIGEDWSYLIGDLEPGEEVHFSQDLMVPEGTRGRLTSRSVVTGSSGGETVTDEQERVMEVVNPESCELSLSKTGPRAACPGETITYMFAVSNTGNVPLHKIKVTDALFGSNWSNNLGKLPPGRSIKFTYRYKIPAQAKGPLENNAQAMGETQDGQKVTARGRHRVEIAENPTKRREQS